MTRSLLAQRESALWRYRAKAIRVVDGDTVVLEVDLGFRIVLTEPVRLAGINTPELIGKDSVRARQAKMFTQEWLSADPMLYIQTQLVREREKYGRILATLYREDDPVSLNDALVKADLAVEYDG
jgi:micrococcal nuclease